MKQLDLSKRCRPPLAIGCWDAKWDILPMCTIGTKILICARPFGAWVGAFGVPEFSPVTGGVRSFRPPVLSSHFVCELLDSNDRVENSVHFTEEESKHEYKPRLTTPCFETPEKLDGILSRLNVVEVGLFYLGDRVKKRPISTNYRGLCPFHHEKNLHSI